MVLPPRVAAIAVCDSTANSMAWPGFSSGSSERTTFSRAKARVLGSGSSVLVPPPSPPLRMSGEVSNGLTLPSDGRRSPCLLASSST